MVDLNELFSRTNESISVNLNCQAISNGPTTHYIQYSKLWNWDVINNTSIDYCDGNTNMYEYYIYLYMNIW